MKGRRRATERLTNDNRMNAPILLGGGDKGSSAVNVSRTKTRWPQGRNPRGGVHGTRDDGAEEHKTEGGMAEEGLGVEELEMSNRPQGGRPQDDKPSNTDPPLEPSRNTGLVQP